jgi:ADP-dependent NAD(P)H-hydrate dehydratase
MSGVEDVALGSLSRFPLPALDDDGDKEERGRVLVIAGSASVPGAAVLAGTAALRAGAGKLRMAASPQARLHLGFAVPEAAIVEVGFGAAGEFGATPTLRSAVQDADGVVIGPGMADEEAAGALVGELLRAPGHANFVIDAAAMTGLRLRPAEGLEGRLVLTPHAGEMAKLAGRSKAQVVTDPLAAAREVAAAIQAVVVMKGAETFIATPQGHAFRHAGGLIGLATSGSGDVLAGLIGGLLARGAPPATAAIWGVCVHAGAGARLAAKLGEVGFLARELLAELPCVLDAAG